MNPVPQPMTITDFDELTATAPSGRYELLDGVVVQLPQPTALQNFVLYELVRLLWEYLAPQAIGMAFSYSIEFVLSDDTLILPDLSFVAQDRLPDVQSRLHLAPDLAVKMASPTDTPRQLQEKALLYLRHGVREVWLIYPENRIVDVCAADRQGVKFWFKSYHVGDTLAGGDVLPGFEIAVGRLFPKSRE